LWNETEWNETELNETECEAMRRTSNWNVWVLVFEDEDCSAEWCKMLV
jgi:hypothetical protein